jgi:hypothetical protein
VKLAGDKDSLDTMRLMQRGIMESSPLMDEAGFSADFEQFVRSRFDSLMPHSEGPRP